MEQSYHAFLPLVVQLLQPHVLEGPLFFCCLQDGRSRQSSEGNWVDSYFPQETTNALLLSVLAPGIEPQGFPSGVPIPLRRSTATPPAPALPFLGTLPSLPLPPSNRAPSVLTCTGAGGWPWLVSFARFLSNHLFTWLYWVLAAARVFPAAVHRLLIPGLLLWLLGLHRAGPALCSDWG